MFVKRLISCFWAAVFASSAIAEEPKSLWESSPNSVPTSAAVMGPEDISSKSIQLAESAALGLRALSVPAEVETEIAELAKALENNPVKIFNYVRNQIDYEHYYGLRKGPVLTLLEGSGNDFDQCVLLADLLKAAGYQQIEYRYRTQKVDYAQLKGWVGLADDAFPGRTFQQVTGQTVADYFSTSVAIDEQVAKQAVLGVQFLRHRGSQVGASTAAIWSPDLPAKASFVMDRLCLEVMMNGVSYSLDPSYKTYEKIPGVAGVLNSLGYSRSSFMSQAGGGTNPDYAVSLSESNVRTNLTSLTSSFLQFVATNYPNLTVSEFLGGRRIIRSEISDLSAASLLSTIAGTDVSWAEIPTVLESKVRFQAGTMDYTIPTSQLDGRKISMTFSGNRMDLRLDDGGDPVASADVPDPSITMTMTVTHPGLSHITSQGVQQNSESYIKGDNYAYAIVYGFSASGRLLEKRNAQLNKYLAADKLDSSREVRSEVLNVMGLAWLYQTELAARLLADQNDVRHLYRHRFGRAGQEQSFYVDVKMQVSDDDVAHGRVGDGKFENVFQLGALFHSAMERGIIEQMQPGYSAVSTVDVLRKANAIGSRLYKATPTNWSSVKAAISGYSAGDLSKLDSHISIDQATLFLPRSGSISDGDWTGSAWAVRSEILAGMMIGGEYNGGYATDTGFVTSPGIAEDIYSNPTTYSLFQMPQVASNLATPRNFGADPVNMASGAFEYTHTDMETGGEGAPRGLAFTRSYSSKNSEENKRGVGYGWTHSLYIRASKRTATEETLGLGTIQQAASFIVATLVGADLYRTDASPAEWGAAVLTADWFQDNMLDNAVAVTMGDNSVQFIKQPNGTYQAPAGSTASLQVVSGNFRFSERHGNTLHFQATEAPNDKAQRVSKIVDPDGKEMTFDYLPGDLLEVAKDCYGRYYKFTYDESRIIGIADSTGRSVSFLYDGFENLTRSSDPEGKFQYFDYQVAGDPGGTIPRDHRMVRLRNHDDQVITQNRYDGLGRVTEQFLHGDPSKTWKLRYTGTANTEENPSGGVTTYLYDERGRSKGKIDPSGLQESWAYDGQDRIVGKTTGSGETTVFTYDVRHNLIRIDHPRGGGSTQLFYDALDRLDLTIDPDGRQTDNVYNSGNTKARPDQVIDPAGTTTYLYKTSGAAVGRVSKVTDGNGLITEYEYDSYGNPDWIKEPGAYLTQLTYSSRGDLLDSTDPNSVKTVNVYNARRQVVKTTTDQGGATEAVQDFVFDNQGLLARKTEAADNGGQRFSTRYEYSPTEKERYARTSDNDGEGSNDPYTEITYDGRDWQSTSRDSGARLSVFTPKVNGQPWKTTITLNREKIQLQDGDGRPTGGTVPGSSGTRSSSITYDVASSGYPRMVTTTADGLSVSEVQDRSGNPRFYTNRKGNVWEFRYDGLGRKTHVITPLDAAGNRTHLTEYYHRGVVKKVTEPSGQITNFTYHATSGRLLSVADGVGTISHTAYDNNGNLLNTSEVRSGSTKTTSRTYDRQNRIASRTDENGQTVGYRYYPSGKLWKIVYPGGTDTGVGHVEYTWWQDGNLKDVIDKLDSTTTPRTTSYQWNKDGRLAKISRPNGTVREVKYDAAGRPDVIEEYGPNLQLIWVHKHGFYPSDEMAWRYELPAKQTSGTDPPAMLAMTYNADNQLATWGGQPVTHDFDGNLITGPAPDGSSLTSYTYDARNRLTAALGTSYTYDADGHRVKLVNGADTTTFVTDVSARISKVLVRTKNGVNTRYVWGAGLLYEVNGSGGSATTVSYHHNASGSTMALTNGAGSVIERIEYTPWGQIRNRANVNGMPHDTPFLFTGFFGNQTDANGLLHMRARYYHPRLGRFLNADPAQEGMNWYGYAGGNPVGMVDPMGLGIEGALDAVQSTLSYLGMIPVFGAVFDIANTAISIGRGNYVDAAMNFASALPGLGDLAGGMKIAGASKMLAGGLIGARLAESAAEATVKAPLWTSTKSKTAVENAFGHWKKHGAEFPEFQNAKQYVEGTQSFFNSSPTGTLTKVRPNGDTLFYNPTSNTFGVKAADGAPRTMFRPSDGINYWNKQ